MTTEEMNCKLVCLLGRQIEEGNRTLSNIPHAIKLLLERGTWKRYRIFTGEIVEHKHFSEFVTSEPPKGWGFESPKVEALLNDAPEIHTKWREAMKMQGDRTDLKDADFCNNVTEVKAITGNSKSYTQSRLKRENPELFKRVCDKEISANAAAILAGWRKVKTPIEKAVDAFRKLSIEEMGIASALISEIQIKKA